MGDLNSRTGKYLDFVSQEENNVITNDQSEFSLSFNQSLDNKLNLIKNLVSLILH